MPSNRQRKLDAVVARLQLQYGPAAVRKAAPPAEPVARLSTTFSELDAALGGGLPRGRITEIIGAATSGKVTLAAKVLAAAHAERDALVAWLDLPRTCDPDYLHRCGIDLDRLLVVRPRDGADALAITLHLVESDTLAALVFDGTARPGTARRQIPPCVAGSLERLATVVTQTQTAVIFLTEPHAHIQDAGACGDRAAGAAPRALAARAAMTCAATRRRSRSSSTGWGRPARVMPLRIVFNGTVRGAGLVTWLN